MSIVVADVAFNLGLSAFFEGIRDVLDDMRVENAAWGLGQCCNEEEALFLGFYGGYVFLFFVAWRNIIFKPMRLLAVFLHEFGHATACWLTGGKVHTIKVYENEGGVTKYQGGIRILVIPAGYIGGAFFGGVFVALSGHRIGATIVAILMTFALIYSLCCNPNRTVIAISLGFSLLNILAICLEWYVFTPILPFITLFYGVYIGLYSVRDIYDDLITRTAEGSDAVACHKECPCCRPRCVGVQFWIVAFLYQILGIYFALVWLVST